jgi:hypothetical protein
MLLDAHVKAAPLGVKPNKNDNAHKRPPKAAPNATEAALLAYALVHGRLTGPQACRLAGASTAYLSIVTRMSAEERERLARGELSLGQLANAKRNGNGNGHAETLVEHLKRSTPAELIAAVRGYGISSTRRSCRSSSRTACRAPRWWCKGSVTTQDS